MKLVIAQLQGSQANSRAEFTQVPVLVGRDPSQCALCFTEKDAGVSRLHAEFSLYNDLLVIRDLASTYGTFVNMQRIQQPTQVTPGTVIQFGQGGPVIRVEFFDPRAGQPAAPQPVVPPAPATYVPAGNPPVPTIQGTSVAGSPPNVPPVVSQPRPRVETPPGVAAPSVPSNGGAAFLELINAPVPERFPLGSTTVIIGREESNAIRLDAAVFPTVSRKHVEIRPVQGEFVVSDLGSFNGTFLDGQRLAAPTTLRDGNRIQVGFNGPEFRFVRGGGNGGGAAVPVVEGAGGTMVVKALKSGAGHGGEARRFVARKEFTGSALTLGRGPDNDLQLDVLQISKHHAKFVRQGGTVVVEDAGSTNGVYVNGQRIGKHTLGPNDFVQVGPFHIQVDPSGVTVFDTRSKARIDVLDLTKEVPNRDGSGTLKLLDRVRLSIPANEFVGLLGPSGAGKSTLMDALNGMRPADQGAVLINSVSLYENINSFKQSIGYVPQDDIIHRELTVYRTLYYVAKMRLSADTSDAEMDQIITEVLDVTGLTARRDVKISQLSGGQRKRVSIAVELITKPSIIFLDEPTSGLDPGTEEKIMRLFRQISEAGHSVVLTTHAMENVKLFDKIVVMMRGRLVWYGPPREALDYFGIANIKDLFDTLGDPNSDQLATQWQRKFEQSPEYKKYVMMPLGALPQTRVQPPRKAVNDNTPAQSVRQTFVLARRYFDVMRADKFNLAVMLGQAPTIALLLALAVEKDWLRDFPYFILALSSLWFGCSNSAREIVKELSVYKRERMVNLAIVPYILSKLVILLGVGIVQVGLLYGVTAVTENIPGNPLLVYGCLLASTLVGISIGLLISAAVTTAEVATSLVPLILIPQILFGGLLLPNKGAAEIAGVAMPAMWSYDLLKHIGIETDGLKTLRGARSEDDLDGEIGRIKQRNTEKIDAFKEELEQYKDTQQRRLNDYKDRADAVFRGGPDPGPMPELGETPKAPTIEYPPEDKSGYVGFVGTFGSIPLNFTVLAFFFLVLTGLAAFILRGKDVL